MEGNAPNDRDIIANLIEKSLHILSSTNQETLIIEEVLTILINIMVNPGDEIL